MSSARWWSLTTFKFIGLFIFVLRYCCTFSLIHSIFRLFYRITISPLTTSAAMHAIVRFWSRIIHRPHSTRIHNIGSFASFIRTSCFCSHKLMREIKCQNSEEYKICTKFHTILFMWNTAKSYKMKRNWNGIFCRHIGWSASLPPCILKLTGICPKMQQNDVVVDFERIRAY